MIKERLIKFSNILQEHQLDAIFIINKANIRFLSGYTGDDAYLFITPKRRALITDSRYTEQAGRECAEYEVITHHNPDASLMKIIKQLCAEAQVKQLAFERNHLSYLLFENLQQALAGTAALIPTGELAESLRYTKSPEEITLMRQACANTDKALQQICQYIRPGVSEKDIARELLYAILSQGCESSFQIIVASGNNGSLPHAIPSDKIVANGEFITIDFGCCYQGYHADMTRTVFLGKPNPQQKERYELVLAAKQQAEAMLKSGVMCKTVDATARDFFARYGYGEYFCHGLGHGVGLDIHENPSLNRISEQVLQSNCLVTVEPGIYLPGWGGIRIEDTVLITDNGYESLFSSPLELLCL